MKEKIIELAKENGFESNHFDIEFTGHTDLIYYLLLCDIRLFLFNKHKFIINIEPYSITKLLFSVDVLLWDGKRLKLKGGFDRMDTINQALEKGCFEALKLIK